MLDVKVKQEEAHEQSDGEIGVEGSTVIYWYGFVWDPIPGSGAAVGTAGPVRHHGIHSGGHPID